MAGLINEQMQSQGDQTADQIPMNAEMGSEPDEDEINLDDPKLNEAVEYLQDVLYDKAAAKDISEQLKIAPNIVDALANIAYDITSIVDEKTRGEVPDELLAPLAMIVLQEIIEIAEATGIDPAPEDVASAFKQMILRYLQEQGADTTQLDQAMNQVDPALFRQAAEEKTEEV